MSVRPLTFAITYFAVLLVFSGIYYRMPDADFYHQSIKYEPNSVAHLDRLKDALNDALQIEGFANGPHGVSVNFTPVYDLAFPAKDSVTFTVGYYYEKLSATDLELPDLTLRCGPSERSAHFYLRTMSYRMTTSTSSGGHSLTVHFSTRPLSECDEAVLGLLYRSIEKSSDEVQAMVSIKPELNGLIEAVSEEQLGYAPRAFGLDRFSRMFYFSVAAMTTTGFGDILPLTTSVRLLASGETILGIVLAGLFLNAIAKSSRSQN